MVRAIASMLAAKEGGQAGPSHDLLAGLVARKAETVAAQATQGDVANLAEAPPATVIETPPRAEPKLMYKAELEAGVARVRRRYAEQRRQKEQASKDQMAMESQRGPSPARDEGAAKPTELDRPGTDEGRHREVRAILFAVRKP